MNTRWILAAAVLAVVSVGLLVAADAPATKPVAIATVGSVEIMTEQVEQIVARQQVPADAVSDGVKTHESRRPENASELGGVGGRGEGVVG